MIVLAPGQTRALHGGEPDRAAADHHDRVGAGDARDIERGAHPRHDAATDEAGTIKRHVLGNGDGLLIRNDAIFAEGAQEHQMLERLAALQPRLALPVELNRLRAFGEIFLAEDRNIAIAIEAMPAMRIPGQDDTFRPCAIWQRRNRRPR